jgi:hypothetical protein
MLNRRNNDFMDIELLANKINLNSELKNKVLSLVERDRAKLISLCKKADNDNFKSVFAKNDMIKLAVALLYSVEFTYPKYQKAVISDEIYFETMKDIAVWCENNNNKGLKNLPWIKNHLNFELFKLGRLQFQIYKCDNRTLNYDLLPFNFGENLIYVHIPQGEKLVYAECVNSLKNAKRFFGEYFPNYDFDYFFCESWLLYGENWQFMNSSSNILQFSTLFDLVYSFDDDRQAIERIFGKRQLIKSKYQENTALQRSAKRFMQNGGKLGVGIGILNKNDI